jgi:hypothetical protein
MERYYLLDRGFPFFAVISAKDAAELYEATPPEMRAGNLGEGFQYWIVAENGRGRSSKFVSRVMPVPPERLPELCRRLGKLVTLPEGLRPCP